MCKLALKPLPTHPTQRNVQFVKFNAISGLKSGAQRIETEIKRKILKALTDFWVSYALSKFLNFSETAD